jgi:hypothetical protein
MVLVAGPGKQTNHTLSHWVSWLKKLIVRCWLLYLRCYWQLTINWSSASWKWSIAHCQIIIHCLNDAKSQPEKMQRFWLQLRQGKAMGQFADCSCLLVIWQAKCRLLLAGKHIRSCVTGGLPEAVVTSAAFGFNVMSCDSVRGLEFCSVDSI